MHDSLDDPWRFRVGVLADANGLPRHIAHIASELARGGVAVTVLRDASPRPPRPRADRFASIVGRAYGALDRRILPAVEDPIARVPLRSVAGVAVTDAAWIDPDSRAPGTAVDPGDGDRLAALRLDAIVDAGLLPVRFGVDGLARLGRWRMTPECDGWPALITDLERGAVATRAWVTVHLPGVAPMTVAEAVVPCSPYALRRNRATVRWQSAHLLLRVLSRQAGAGTTVTAAPATSATPGERLVPAPPVASAPRVGPARAVGLVARLMVRVAVRSLSRAFWREEWFVSVRTRREEVPANLVGFEALVTPGGPQIADPHLVDDDGQDYLFVEDLERATGRGRIAAIRLLTDGRVAEHRLVLDAPYHLSYPCVIRWRGAWYLLPEAWASERLDLYRADVFPWSWSFDTTLFDGVRAADPTIHVRDGRLWLFMTITARGLNPWDELSVFWADDIHGPWHRHPGNPVVTDTRRARPAGPLFVRDGALIRPAQDCSGDYGRRIVLNRVDRLDEEEYLETPIGTIEPSGLPGLRRTHCYSRTQRLEALDGRRRRPRLTGPRPRVALR